MNPEHTHEWFVDGVVSRCGVCGVTAQPVSPSEGEAVAWLLRNAAGGEVLCREHPGDWPNTTVLPLYAHPASDQSDTERMRAAVMLAADAPVWADGIITDGERVAFAQKAAADYGGTYWATDEGNGAVEWEPTHFIDRAALAEKAAGQ